jgi:hypothetical protein
MQGVQTFYIYMHTHIYICISNHNDNRAPLAILAQGVRFVVKPQISNSLSIMAQPHFGAGFIVGHGGVSGIAAPRIWYASLVQHSQLRGFCDSSKSSTRFATTL